MKPGACAGLALLGLTAALAAGADPRWEPRRGGVIRAPHGGRTLRVISWNIERGTRFGEIRRYLEQQQPDLVLLQEADWEARRSGGRRIAEELGALLGLEWVFAPEFLELGQRIGGRDAWHGQATLSRLPVSAVRVLRFRAQSAGWRPKWWLPDWSIFQPREGGRIALVTEHRAAGARLAAYNLHLESRDGEDLRLAQIEEVLEDARRQPPEAIVVVAGDFNTKEGGASPVIRRVESEGFSIAAGGQITTTRRQALDWVFVRGPVQAVRARVRNDVRPADHFPVQADLALTAQDSVRGQ